MKKYKTSSIKRSILSGIMTLTLLGVTGCSSEKNQKLTMETMQQKRQAMENLLIYQVLL